MRETSKPCGAAAEPRGGEKEEAWAAFLRENSAVILQVVRLFERDQDEADEAFLFVCERLRRDGLRRIHRYRQAGPASFSTWLRAVVRRLCLDWRRHRDGRFRLPRAVARLPAIEREVFRSIHLRGLTQLETVRGLAAVWPGITLEQVSEAAGRVGRALRGRQNWFLLVRRPRFLSLSAGAGVDPADAEGGLIDPRAGPEAETAEHERREIVHRALRQLSPSERLLLQLRYEQDLTLEEIARAIGLATPAQVERKLQHALETLKAWMSAHGIPCLSVK